MATYTATLNLSDSGNTFSSSTSSPLKMNTVAYTKCFSRQADTVTGDGVTTGYVIHSIPFDAEFVMVRAINGTIFATLYDSGNVPSDPTESSFKLTGATDDKGAQGWLMYGCTTAPTSGNAINRIRIINTSGSTSTYQIIAYA